MADVGGHSAADAMLAPSVFAVAPAPMLIIAADTPRFTISDVNQAYLAAVMRTRDDVVGRGVFEALPDNPDDPDATGVANLRASIERVIANGQADSMPLQRYDIPHPDGSFEERWWDPVNAPMLDARGAVAAVVHYVVDVTDRVRAEAAVQAQVARQAFRLALEERLRAVADPVAMMEIATAMLGEHLNVAQVGFGEVDEPQEHVLVHRDWTDGRVGSVVGRWRMDDFGPAFIREMKRGETVAIPDITRDPRTDAPAIVGAYAGISTRAILDVPLVRDRRMRAMLFIHHPVPRTWDTAEIALVEETCARLWSTVERARAEEELRASEELNRRILTSSADCIKVLDDDGRVEFMSEGGMCAMEVDDFSAIDGAHWPDFWAGEGHDNAMQAVDAAKRGETGRFLGFAPTMKGTPRWWDVIVTPIPGADGRPEKLLAISRDVTATKEAEAALRENQRELQVLADTLPVLVSYIDAGRRYRFVNRTYKEWFPDHWATMQGAHVREVVGDAAYLAVEPWIDRALAGESVSFEQLMPYRIGTARHIKVEYVPRVTDGAVEGFYALVQDVSDQKRAEAALRASEAQLSAIFSHAAVGLSEVGLDGRFVRVNDELCQIVGRGRDALLGVGISEITHPDDVELSLAQFAIAADAGAATSFDKRYVRADGTIVWANSSLSRLGDETGDTASVLAVTVDLTERKRAEAALRESEEQLRLATEAAEIGLWDLDVVTDTLFWPPRVKAMFGISADVAISMADYYAGLHPDDAATTAAAFGAAIDPTQRALYDVEYRTIGKEDGVVRWVAAKGRGQFDADDRCIRVIGTAIDVTSRKRTEEQLRELNEQLETRVADVAANLDRVWRNASDMFVVIDREGVFQRVNPAATRILGWSEAEMVGRPVFDFIVPDDEAPTQGALAHARTTPLPVFENRYRTKGGDIRSISWVAAPEGDLIYAYGRDVTAEKLHEAELEAAQEALRQSQKMEAMGQLTGGVAHDFNNLLTPIVGALDILRRKELGGEREQRLIGGAVQSAERAKTLVQRLLSFARRQPLQATSVDLASLVGGMADLIGSTTGPQIRVAVETAADLPPAMADANQLEMALLNLAVNARDAMPEGGTLRISVGEEWIDAPHRTGLTPGHYVRLSVADTGIGMDDATLARAIEPFFSTKGVGKGTGLGLSMVHGLASQLGGVLAVQSRRGVGTNVEIWLPVGAARTPGAGDAPRATGTLHTTGTALLVDDEELVRMSTADMLSDLGYAVVEAASAEEALAMTRGGLEPDLLITDHLMPGMTGTELARVMRSERPGLQVLLVSGYAETDGVAPDLPRLTKPFRNDELVVSLSGLSPPPPPG